MKARRKENAVTYDRNQPQHKRASRLKQKYGLSVAEYDAMLAAQDGRCAICKCEPTDRRLAVDHCHDTNKVRGLLCFTCNTGIGKFRHNKKLLQAAIDYL